MPTGVACIMKMEQISSNCFAVLNEKNRACDANSGLVNLAHKLHYLIFAFTQSDHQAGLNYRSHSVFVSCSQYF